MIVFTGFMGSGKTTAGRAVSRRLGTAFHDSDVTFCEQYGPITDFFDSHGESAFRAHEATIISEHLAAGDVCDVLALGGGAVTTPEVRAMLAGHIVVFLEVSLQASIMRVGQDVNRPVMRAPDLAERYAQRQDLYRQVASLTIQVDRLSSGRAARLVIEKMREMVGLPSAPVTPPA